MTPAKKKVGITRNGSHLPNDTEIRDGFGKTDPVQPAGEHRDSSISKTQEMVSESANGDHSDDQNREIQPEKVGYCRPPQHTRFEKGKSGNPKGRPRGARGLKTDLKAELSKKITVTEGGKKRSMTKQQVVVHQLTSKAAKGDLKAITKLIDLTRDTFGLEDEETKGAAQLSFTDEQILKDYEAEIRDGMGEKP